MKLFRWLCLAFFLFAQALSAQELPPIKNFAPSDFGAENQNWAISQDKDRLVYIANNSGLLVYNGAKWALYPSPNQTIMRSVKVVGDRIYTGCYKEFGYWAKNAFGTLDYYSLADKIRNELLEDEEFWSIAHVEGKVFFQSKKRIYILDLRTESFDYIAAESALPRIFNTQTGVFFHVPQEGLFQLIGGKKVLIAKGTAFNNDEVINVFSINGQMCLLTRHMGFYNLVEGQFKKWQIPANALLDHSNVYSGHRLKDGRFALGTVADGFFLLDAAGVLVHKYNQANGLRNNTVLSLLEDQDQNVWLGLDHGLGYVHLNAPYRVYNDHQGAIGSVYAAIQKDGLLYLGTNQGLFAKKVDGQGPYTLIVGTQGQVWSLKEIGGTLICGHHSGTMLVSGYKAVKIASVPGTWKVQQVATDPNLLLQGNYDGLYVLQQSKTGDWQLRNKIAGFDHSSRYFEVLGNQIFVNHEYKGVFQLKVDTGLTKVLHLQLDAMEPGFNSSIVTFNNNLLYAHKLGVLRYDPLKDVFVKDSVLSKVYAPAAYLSGKMVVDQSNNHLWFFSKDHLSRVYSGKLKETYLIDHLHVNHGTREGVDGYESITHLTANNYLLGTSSGYITIDLAKIKEQHYSVAIGAITQENKGQTNTGANFIVKERGQTFEHDHNNLAFSFYTTAFDPFVMPKYQYQLEQLYPNWSNWSTATSVSFENLPPGNYTFKVRSMVGDVPSANTASFSFKIAKPWHSATPAIVLYVVLGLLGSFLIHTAYRRYYRNKQNKLIQRNKREMELAKAQSDKEIIKLKNEQLQKEFKSKSNELAASTLSIIKKNELLTKVKEELMANPESKSFAYPLVEIIDKNLKKNDDWELFKEAFNNADRKFLKKLKKAHAKLTPNDIRLCAYLRLNLSSKEIAPLLNISARSVEIKRYRLRKKMNLTHDENLVDYILKL